MGYRAFYLGDYPPGFRERYNQTASAFYSQLVELGKRQGDIAPTIDTDLAAFLFDTILSNLPSFLLNRMPAEEQSSEAGTRATALLVTDSFGQIVGILDHGMGYHRP